MKKEPFNRRSNERGMILPMALVLMVAAMFIVVPMLTSVTVLANVGRDSELHSSAYYAADAGIQTAIWRLKNSPSTLMDPVADVNGMQVAISYAADPYTPSGSTMTVYPIKSTAGRDGATLAEVYILFDVDMWRSPFEQAIVALDGNIELGNFTINGDIFANSSGSSSNGNVIVSSPGGAVNGSVYATNNISGPVTTTEPPLHPNVGSQNFYDVDFDGYKQQALAGGTQTPDQFFASGGAHDMYVNGNLDIPNKANLNITGVVYVNGYISAQNNCTIRGGGYLISEGYMDFGNNVVTAERLSYMSRTGNIDFHCNATTYHIYAPQGTATLWSNSNVLGSIVGQSVEVKKGIIYLPDEPPIIDVIITNPTFSMRGYSYQ